MPSPASLPEGWLLTVAAVAVAYAAWVGLRTRWHRWERRRRFARASEGEREAAALLEDAGFRIERAQAQASYDVDVDGEAVSFAVRADYVVVRGRERFVAEVKTGRSAPRLDTATTRRQLLEYHHAFDAAGILLVDADARTIRRVAFRGLPRHQTTHVAGWVLFVCVAAALVAVLAPLR